MCLFILQAGEQTSSPGSPRFGRTWTSLFASSFRAFFGSEFRFAGIVGCVSRREVSRCYSGWVYHCLDDVNIQVWTSVFRGCSEMEKKFSVEAKSFAFVALDGASVLRVVEKRNKFLGEVVLSAQCSNWLASTLEVLMGISEDQEFVKSFREGSKF